MRASRAQVLELVDKLDLGSSALVAWGFDSPPGHHFRRNRPAARVVKLVDTRDLKSLGGNPMPVQVRLRAPLI
jgi:hypothetical protein